MEQDQEFVEYVVKNLVDNPGDVTTERTVDEMGVLITLKVNPNDLGQIIGRNGQTAKAIRTLLRVVGAKHKARVNMKIYEPEGHRKADRMAAAAAGSRSESVEGAPSEAMPATPPAEDHAAAVESDVDDLKL
ncbi:MAG: KH domain-containing protein [Candidatus Kerfeldbacteria bacterium]|nr:KH domain-containing protein [Candidatus Kerfeldbacteria bacterium]